jgi:tripartite-type tricarboxylate transporter receptor subunit TctC
VRKALLLAALAWPVVAGAQAWPAKPVRLVSPSATGTPPDVALRHVAERLTRNVGQPFVIDNIVGGVGLMASQNVARAAPDGYSYLVGGVGVVATDRHMFKSLPYDPDRDFVPVAMLYDSAAFAIVVQPDMPAKNVPDLIALSKAQPGKLVYGTGAVGVTAITGQWFNIVAGTTLEAVPYKNPAQLMQDLAAGRLPLAFYTVGALVPHHKSGKLRILAVTSDRRYPELKDVPTVAETLRGFKVVGLGILVAPTGTPAAIVQRLNREIDPIVREPEYEKRLLALGFTNADGAGTPQSLAAFMKNERALWDRMLSGVKIEPQ